MKSLILVSILAFLAASANAAQAAAPSKPDLAKGATISANVCGACHTNDGSRGLPIYPILQGQQADYIVKQLGDFKAGRRDNPIMKPMAMTVSDDDMRNVAAFYASKIAKPGDDKSPATVAEGRQLWRAGNAYKHVPACAGCHGPAGAGLPAQYPRLAGQHAEYLTAQLQAFRDGKRTNSPQMVQIAGRMSDADIAAVAAYAEGLK